MIKKFVLLFLFLFFSSVFSVSNAGVYANGHVWNFEDCRNDGAWGYNSSKDECIYDSLTDYSDNSACLVGQVYHLPSLSCVTKTVCLKPSDYILETNSCVAVPNYKKWFKSKSLSFSACSIDQFDTKFLALIGEGSTDFLMCSESSNTVFLKKRY